MRLTEQPLKSHTHLNISFNHHLLLAVKISIWSKTRLSSNESIQQIRRTFTHVCDVTHDLQRRWTGLNYRDWAECWPAAMNHGMALQSFEKSAFKCQITEDKLLKCVQTPDHSKHSSTQSKERRANLNVFGEYLMHHGKKRERKSWDEEHRLHWPHTHLTQSQSASLTLMYLANRCSSRGKLCTIRSSRAWNVPSFTHFLFGYLRTNKL